MEQDFDLLAGESPEHSERKSKGQVGEKDFITPVIEGKLPACEVKIGAESDVATAEGKIRSLVMGNKLRSWAEVLSGPTPKQPELLLGSNSGLGMLPKAVNQELIEETKVVDQPIGGSSSPVIKEQNLDLDLASDRELASLDHFGLLKTTWLATVDAAFWVLWFDKARDGHLEQSVSRVIGGKYTSILHFLPREASRAGSYTPSCGNVNLRQEHSSCSSRLVLVSSATFLAPSQQLGNGLGDAPTKKGRQGDVDP
ncbi:hypothetical protein V6N13_056695 [Hibiscus sabdariffa]